MEIPKYWEQPKYHLGQQVKQGLIVGCRYYTQEQSNNKWEYAVTASDFTAIEDAEYYPESLLEPLTIAQLRQQIQKDIDFHNKQLNILNAQANELESE